MDSRLPDPIATYIEAVNAGDLEPIAACFTDDAVVLDEGQAFKGIVLIRSWIKYVKDKFKHTIEPLSCALDGGKFVTTGRVHGDFPHSPVDLTFIYEIEGDRISYLECPLPEGRVGLSDFSAVLAARH